ncbi:2-alkenal reductase [Candidatus Parcubacteria bacterium]|nr:MAG: 2-alkenal reductase [Candidatus Parcubacteria bacterium]
MQKNIIKISFLAITLAFVLGSGFFMGSFYPKQLIAENLSLDEQEATVRAIEKTIPAVVSILVYNEEDIVYYNLDTGGQTATKENRLKGRGTGFIISSEGYILTNKHVVSLADKSGSYRIVLNSGKQYYAQLIGKDPINDLAVLKIFDQNLPYIELGDSSSLKVGYSVIAIGNALGVYNNTVTKGIVSGLGRSILASDANGTVEYIDNTIQTDAEINLGNSGGPLVDLNGKVVGVNVATDESGSSIGFAIPINDARPVINSIIESGRIIRPRLGLQYIMLTPEIALDNKLNKTEGAWISTGNSDSNPIVEGGPADLAGLEPGDIVFEINAIKVQGTDTLLSIIQRYKPGDKIGMKVLRGERVLILVAELDEFK